MVNMQMKEEMDEGGLLLIRSCVHMLVHQSMELGAETKASWENAVEDCNPEIWKDVLFLLHKTKGKRGKKKSIRTLDEILIGDAAHFGKFAMEVNNLLAASLFVQIINILCHHMNIEPLLKADKNIMSVVWFDVGQLGAESVVEIENHLGVARQTFGRCHILNAVIVPVSARIAEGAKPTLNTDSGTRECH